MPSGRRRSAAKPLGPDPAMGERLEGKVALISGTAGAPGRVAALRFADEGACVVRCDLDDRGNAETVAMVEAAGGTMTGMAPVDLSDPAGAERWVEQGASVYGRIDILYNNASAARIGVPI